MKLFKNIGELYQVRDTEKATVSGSEMAELPSLKKAWLLEKNGQIRDFGQVDTLPDGDFEIIDCKGQMMLPGFVDPHTHIVFADSREEEFDMRLKGASYQEIAAQGGGILNSAAKLAKMDESQLLDKAAIRLEDLISKGTTTIEIKSGYGLTPEAELKMLRVIRKLKERYPLSIKSTFLGAHAYPAQFKDDHDGYLKQIEEEMLPRIADEGLADYIDVFCEKGYFSIYESQRIIEAGAKYGLKPKIHVNQFTTNGGVQMGVEAGALSVDHLEACGGTEIDALKGKQTIPTLLPSCSFFLNIPYAPARDLIAAGLPVALGTDYNPGSTPSGNVPFLLSLACIKMRMTPEEAINAVTMNAAAALELSNEVGSISKGKQANLILLKPMKSLSYLMYAFGNGADLIDEVWVKGIGRK